MTKTSRALLTAALLLAASCGFTDAQKARFVSRVTLVILDATASDTEASAPVAANLVSSAPARNASPTVAPPAKKSCPKVDLASNCPKRLRRPAAAAAEFVPLFAPETVSLESKVRRTRFVFDRVTIERLQCEASRTAAKTSRELTSARVRTQFTSRVVRARGAAGELTFSFVTDPDPIPEIPPAAADEAADTVGG
jgi:hypothetical protein